MNFQALPTDIKNKYQRAAEKNLLSVDILAIKDDALHTLIWPVIRIFELNLRFFLNEYISRKFNDSKWWRSERLIYKEHMARSPSSDNPYEVINLGFLCLLFSDRYHTNLWAPYLSKALPNWPSTRSELHLQFKSLVQIRNSIAHHEIIYNYPLIELGDFAQQIMLDVNSEAAKTIKEMKIAEKIKAIKLGSGGGI